MYYDGHTNTWKEMPRSSEITDYGIFDNPNWYKDNMKGIELIKDETTTNFNFTI